MIEMTRNEAIESQKQHLHDLTQRIRENGNKPFASWSSEEMQARQQQNLRQYASRLYLHRRGLLQPPTEALEFTLAENAPAGYMMRELRMLFGDDDQSVWSHIDNFHECRASFVFGTADELEKWRSAISATRSLQVVS